MKKAWLLLLFALGLAHSIHAQQQYRTYYKDKLEKGETMLAATVMSISVRTAEGRYVQKIFYPEKKALTHAATYRDSSFSIMEGLYLEWYDNGLLWKEGAYKNNLPDGPWTFYAFPDGKKSEYGNFDMGKKIGRWVTLDSMGNKLKAVHYKEGKLHGACNIFNKSGNCAIFITYEEGKKVKEETWIDHADIDLSLMDALDVRPYIKSCENEDPELRQQCNDEQYGQAIYKNIRYPEKAREEDIEGRAVLRFAVEKDGTISEVTVLRGICTAIEQECRRAMRFMPPWMPGIKNGSPVKVYFELPIRFKLE